MKQFKMLLGLMLLTLLVFSCKKDEEATPENVSGTYTMTSITTDIPVDANGNGMFDDMELIDDVPCISRLIIDATNSFTWEYPSEVQQSILQWGNSGGVSYPVEYSGVYCNAISTMGNYTLTDNSLVLSLDFASLTEIINVINTNELHYVVNATFVVENNSALEAQSVTVTMKYTK